MKSVKLTLVAAFAAVFAASAATNTLTIIQTTDIHADPDFARLATHIARERAANGDVLLVDCGDLTRNTGNFAATIDGGAAEVATLNAKIRLIPSVSGVAVIGLVSPDRERWYGGILYRGIATQSAAKALDEVLPDVRRAKPDIVVVAAHLSGRSSSGADDAALAKLSDFLAARPDVTLLLAGHTHQTIPLQRLSDSCWMVQPPYQAKAAARVTLSFDTDRRSVVSVTNVFLYARDAEPWPKMPREWTARSERAKTAGDEVVAVLPEGVRLCPASKDPAAENPLPGFCAQAMAEATHADAALAEVGRRVALPTGVVTRVRVYRLAPREDYLSVIAVSPDDLRRIVDEQKAKGCRLVSHALDYDNLPDHPIRLALGAYAADGSDGAYPVLREIANAASAAREDTEISLRGCVELLLRRLCPPPAKP